MYHPVHYLEARPKQWRDHGEKKPIWHLLCRWCCHIAASISIAYGRNWGQKLPCGTWSQVLPTWLSHSEYKSVNWRSKRMHALHGCSASPDACKDVSSDTNSTANCLIGVSSGRAGKFIKTSSLFCIASTNKSWSHVGQPDCIAACCKDATSSKAVSSSASLLSSSGVQREHRGERYYFTSTKLENYTEASGQLRDNKYIRQQRLTNYNRLCRPGREFCS